MKVKSLTIRPITYRDAADFVNMHHRHHMASVGCKFCISVYHKDTIAGVAICGRPVARHYDNGLTCEITRVCTDGTPNACSCLYGACCRIAKEMGYEKIITYTLQSENGASMRASGFTYDGEAGGTHWTGSRNLSQPIPHEKKKRWVKVFNQRKYD